MTQSDLKYYFVDRFQELLNWNSIDSYRVKCYNVFSLIKELRAVIDNWLQGYVKQFETVCLCIDETLIAMKEDDIIDYSFYDKQLMEDALIIFEKSDHKNRTELGNGIIYLLDKCIYCNQNLYLDKLYDAIFSIINNDEDIEESTFMPLVGRLNRIMGDLACELLNEGFSLRHLYRQSCILKENIYDFSNSFSRFRQMHGRNVPLNSYDVVLKLNGGRNNRLTSVNGFYEQLPTDFVPIDKHNDLIDKFLSNRGVIFYSVHVDAHDSAMAIIQAVERMCSVVDRAMLGYSILDVKVQKMALVIIDAQPEKMYVVRQVNVSDSSLADDTIIVNEMIKKVDKIVTSNSVEQDVKDRLTSALRHMRIGSIDADSGQQLINYWVALEFIFSSPKAIDSTTQRLEKYLLNVLMCCYAYRRVNYLNNDLHKNGSLTDDKDWWKLSDEDLNILILKQTNQLTRYHLQEMKAALRNHKDDIQEFFKRHENRLRWQIYRIYRYRNKLIHEAAIVHGLDNMIRCLRFYLVLLLDQFIGYFVETETGTLSMDSFFFEYAQKSSVINNIIKQGASGLERIENIMKIKVYSELIRLKE